MKKRNSIFSFLLSLFVLSILIALPTAAETSSVAPQLPHTFFGMVKVGEGAAPGGFLVEAVGPGVRSGLTENPVTTMAGGVYGRLGWTGQKLVVQGDIEPGTPIEFYVGGVRADVYPVAANGPWLEAYPYIPGEDTEMNLRIASLPAEGLTREPTPVQTRIASGQVPTISGYSGPALPQPEVIATYQPGEAPVTGTHAGEPAGPGDSSQPGAQGGESSGTPAPGGQEAGNPPPGVPATGGGSSMLIGAAIVAFLVIIGAAAYYMSRRKPDDEKKEE